MTSTRFAAGAHSRNRVPSAASGGAELPVAHAAPAKASTERGGALASAPDGEFDAEFCTASVVFSTCCQFLYSGISGNLKAISSGAAFSTIKIGG